MNFATKTCLGGLIAGSIAISACNKGVTRETQAIVLSVDGTASVTHARDGQNEPVRVNARLAKDDLIRTSRDGQVSLQILPGILTRLMADSELKIETLRIAKDGNAMVNAMLVRDARLQLNRGMMDGVVEKKDAGGATLIIATAVSQIEAPGECVFRITVSDQKARVICLRGTMHVQATEGSDNSIEAGYYRDLPGNADPPKRADENGEVQNDVVAALESMQALLDLQTRAILQLAPWRRQSVTEKP